MPQDTRKLCVNCAWRENCAKRFSMESGTTLHCPDYSEDVSLRKEKQEKPTKNIEDGT